jgi:hypothetical protein
MRINQKIELVPRITLNSWDDGNPIDISQYIIPESIQMIDAMGRSKDTAKFIIDNANETFSRNLGINAEDKVRIYQWEGTGSVNTTSDLLIEGIVKTPTFKQTPDESIIDCDIVSYIGTLFQTQVWMNKTATPDVLTQEILSQVNSLNRGFTLYGGNASEWDTLGNPTGSGTAGTTAFPTNSFVKKYTSAIDLIDEVWGSKYTSDGQYIYYTEKLVNGRIGLIVRRRDFTVSGTVTIGGPETKAEVTKKTDNVKNVFYYNLGYDANGNNYNDIYYDITSMSQYGAKTSYYDKTQYIGTNLLYNERVMNSSKFPNYTDSTNNKIVFTSNYPTAFPYTTSVLAGFDSNGNLSSSTVVCATSASFNNTLISNMFYIGKIIMAGIANKYSQAKWAAKITYPKDQAELSMTSIYSVNASAVGLVNYPLRVVRKTYNFWDIDYELEEDEETAGESY